MHFNNLHVRQAGWRWVWAGRASLWGGGGGGGADQTTGYWWVLAYASRSDWAHSQLLPGRVLAQAAPDTLPDLLHRAASSACCQTLTLSSALLCCVDWVHFKSLHGRAHSQAAPGTLLVSMQAMWLGALPVLRCCLLAVCHKWSGALPPLAYAITRRIPRLGTLPGLR